MQQLSHIPVMCSAMHVHTCTHICPRTNMGPPGVSEVNLTEVQYKGQTTKNIQLLHCAAIMGEGSLLI